MRMNKGKPFTDVEADTGEYPVFSEAFLYETVGKGDARFILGIADEYEHIINSLGPAAVCAILDVKPRLVQRLGLPGKVFEWLDDARSDESRRREEQFPSQTLLDGDAANAVWQMLHMEYRRFFNPEESMGKDQLRAYHALTDALGPGYRDQRKAEQEKLPEKMKKGEQRKKEVAAKRKRQRRVSVNQIHTNGGKPNARAVAAMKREWHDLLSAPLIVRERKDGEFNLVEGPERLEVARKVDLTTVKVEVIK